MPKLFLSHPETQPQASAVHSGGSPHWVKFIGRGPGVTSESNRRRKGD